MSFFERLPVEVQLEVLPRVLGCLSNYDLKSVRLVSKRLMKSASIYLFSSVVISFRPEVLKVLHHVSQSPYRIHVKEMKYDASYYDYKLAEDEALYDSKFEQWVDENGVAFDTAMLASLFPGGGSKLAHRVMNVIQEEGFEEYCQCSESQEYHPSHSEKRNRRLLEEPLRNMPNVERITYVGQPVILPAESISKGISRFVVKPRDMTYCDHDDGWSCEEEDAEFFFKLWNSYSSAFSRKKLKQLCIGERLPYFRTSGPAHHGLKNLASELQKYPQLLNNLQTFKVSISVVRDDHPDCDPFETFRSGALGRILARLPQLKHFDLHLGWQFERNTSKIFGRGTFTGTPILPLIIGNPTWHELEDLTLERIYAHAAELVDLVRRHRTTLKRLRLLNIVLRSGSWASVAAYVRDSTSMRSFELRNGCERNPFELKHFKLLTMPFSCKLRIRSDGTRELVGANVPKCSQLFEQDNDCLAP